MMKSTHAASAAPAEFRADHIGHAYEADIALCREALMAGGGLHYIAHTTAGVVDFSLEAAGEDQHGDFSRVGRQMGMVVAMLDETCEPLDTGPLIRVVVQSDAGALFQLLKVSGQNFFGLTLDGTPEAVDHADRAIAAVAETAVARIGAVPLNFGGFRKREGSAELWRPYQVQAASPASGSPYIVSTHFSVPDRTVSACQAALRVDGLHHLSVCHGGEQLWSADLFDEPALAPLFQRVTPVRRRSGYARLIRQIHGLSQRLTRLIDVVGGTQVSRLVLDVARGAIYVTPLSADYYLVGVTLIQQQVNHADLRFQALASEIS
jgi:hypothetical protein